MLSVKNYVLKTVTTLTSRTMSSKVCKDRLKGKVAVVTASTEGIGFGIAKRLASEGAKVLISSRKEAKVNEAVKKLSDEGLSVVGTVCHVANAEHRKNLFKKAKDSFGGIDILVSNAAVNPTIGGVLECDESSWDKIFDVNVKSAFLLAKEVLPYFHERKGGSIVFVSSIAGLQPFSLLGAYSVSKTALLGLTKAAAQSLACDNIRVNCLAPGIVKTHFSEAMTSSKEAEEKALEGIPMYRFGTSDEMGAVVAFLVSDDASYITGETIVSAGGMQSRL